MNETPKTIVELGHLIDDSKVAVVIPLYGFWKDTPTEQLTPDVLQVSMSRLLTRKHKAYFIFVGEPERIDEKTWNHVIKHIQAGNTLGCEVEAFANYSKYVTAGINKAMTETDAEYIVMFNPWNILHEDSLDVLLERINRRDVGIASAYDVRGEVEPEFFDDYKISLPKEERDFNFNFWGFTRAVASEVRFDEGYKTHYFLPRDFWNEIGRKSNEVIVSQFIPIYSLDLDWTLLEDLADYEADKAYFTKKWGFAPEVKYK